MLAEGEEGEGSEGDNGDNGEGDGGEGSGIGLAEGDGGGVGELAFVGTEVAGVAIGTTIFIAVLIGAGDATLVDIVNAAVVTDGVGASVEGGTDGTDDEEGVDEDGAVVVAEGAEVGVGGDRGTAGAVGIEVGADGANAAGAIGTEGAAGDDGVVDVGKIGGKSKDAPTGTGIGLIGIDGAIFDEGGAAMDVDATTVIEGAVLAKGAVANVGVAVS